MKRYILGRVIRSIFSIFAVVTIALILVYTLTPRDSIFITDTTYQKLKAADDKNRYKFNTWESLGYLRFDEQKDMCAKTDDYDACMVVGSDLAKEQAAKYEADGYTVEKYSDGRYYAHKDYSVPELVINWFGRLIKVDHPFKMYDSNNEGLARKIYIENDYNGLPAIKCSGCEHKYLIYMDGTFPFVHQNIVSLDFGISYPTFSGVDVATVITQSQGNAVSQEVTFETGKTSSTAVNLHSCEYKYTELLDNIDTSRFSDNYANCSSNLADPSMISTSAIQGIIALILTYLIGIPAGMVMAANKDKWQDKLGTVYINIMSAVPSLAFIYFVRSIGMFAGLPDKFPVYGAHDVRSYIMPVLILGLLSTGGQMLWIRRYMVDQSSADYVKFARAKGLSNNEIFRTHILRNAIIPFVNGFPSAVILTISGAVITETVFAIPGMGKMLPDSIKAYNNPMVIGLTFIFTAVSIFALLLGDLLVTVVDPRIQLQAKGDAR